MAITDLPARLRALVTQWRTWATREKTRTSPYDSGPTRIERCADDLDALLGALETDTDQCRLDELAYQAARDEHQWAQGGAGHAAPFHACDHPDCRLFRTHDQSPTTPPAGAVKTEPTPSLEISEETNRWNKLALKEAEKQRAGAVGRAEPPGGWQEIAAAPKDGTVILVWGQTRGIDTAYYDPDANTEEYAWTCAATCSSMDHEAKPTYWQALPAPPVTERRAP